MGLIYLHNLRTNLPTKQIYFYIYINISILTFALRSNFWIHQYHSINSIFTGKGHFPLDQISKYISITVSSIYRKRALSLYIRSDTTHILCSLLFKEDKNLTLCISKWTAIPIPLIKFSDHFFFKEEGRILLFRADLSLTPGLLWCSRSPAFFASDFPVPHLVTQYLTSLPLIFPMRHLVTQFRTSLPLICP